jgi:Chaperone of endosialidase
LTSGSNNIAIGHPGVGGEANTLRLGSSSQTRAFIAGITGVPVSGSQVLINSQGQLGVPLSSARYKRDIQAMGERSHGVHQLRPVTFRYKQDPQGQRQYGLIAEEVARVYPELVVRGTDGKVESVQYHELIPMLLNEMQHQQQKLEAQSQQLSAQSQELAELKAQNKEQRAQNAALATRLERLAGAARAATLTTR